MTSPGKSQSYFFTSQNFSSDHPDKLCDYISDSVLDECLKQDPNSKVGCQCVIKNDLCMVFGQITSKSQLKIEQIVRTAIKELGYNSSEKGLDYRTCKIIVAVDKQSPDIAQSVHLQKDQLQIGAGDQGLMIGYATDETQDLMPLSHQCCNLIVRKLQSLRQQKCYSFFKVLVKVEYERQNQVLTPLRIDSIFLECQHQDRFPTETFENDLKKIVQEAVPSKFFQNTNIYINEGEKLSKLKNCFKGLTGRKIIADTYGGWGGHGGGAFSGKDSSKVDRSGGYAARWIAKSLVANNFCKRVLVQISYSIGISKPLSVFVNTYNTVTKGYTDQQLTQIVLRNFDLRPGALIKQLGLKRPIFKKTSHGGHFGRKDFEFTWENVKDLTHQKIK